MAERLFTLTWDNSRYPNLSTDERFRKRECRGIVWDTPVKGLVTLSIGAVYDNMSDMERNLKAAGKVTVRFDDEQQTDEIAAVEEQKL